MDLTQVEVLDITVKGLVDDDAIFLRFVHNEVGSSKDHKILLVFDASLSTSKLGS